MLRWPDLAISRIRRGWDGIVPELGSGRWNSKDQGTWITVVINLGARGWLCGRGSDATSWSLCC